MIRYKIQRKKVKKNEGRDPFKAVRLGCSLLWRTISYSHHILTKAGISCTGSIGECKGASSDTSFHYSLIGISYFMIPHFYQGSTPATTKFIRGGNAIGEAWEDGPSTQQNTQRPALII